MKTNLGFFKPSALAIICLFLLLVPVGNALGIATSPGTVHKTTMALHEIRLGFNPAALTHSGKGLPSNVRTEKRNKSNPNQASNGPRKAAISEQQASAAATAAATAVALFGAAL
ncbi:MAG: hypothetical protein ACLP5H_03350 [Desulfomonilaceae bacterium]